LAIAVIAGIFIYRHLTQENLENVVKAEVKAVKDKHFTEAYYEYTSKKFQQTTSLETFRHFMQQNAIFNDNASLVVTKNKTETDTGYIEAIATSHSGEKEEVLFFLVKEDGRWKIQFIQVGDREKEETALDAISQESQKVLLPLERHLNALKSKDLKGAYEAEVSSEFLKQTPYDTFEAFVKEYPILTNFIQYAYEVPKIDGKKAEVIIVLNPGQENIHVKYKLVDEDEWKIWGMQIILPPSGGSSTPLMHPKELASTVNSLLEMLRQENIEKAYQTYMSDQFKKITTLPQLNAFIEKHPLLASYQTVSFKDALIENGNKGRVTVELKSAKQLEESLLFSLEIQDGSWKIDGIQQTHGQ
jgi:hypothetical protein